MIDLEVREGRSGYQLIVSSHDTNRSTEDFLESQWLSTNRQLTSLFVVLLATSLMSQWLSTNRQLTFDVWQYTCDDPSQWLSTNRQLTSEKSSSCRMFRWSRSGYQLIVSSHTMEIAQKLNCLLSRSGYQLIVSSHLKMPKTSRNFMGSRSGYQLIVSSHLSDVSLEKLGLSQWLSTNRQLT